MAAIDEQRQQNPERRRLTAGADVTMYIVKLLVVSYCSSALHGRKGPVRERSSNADAGTEDQRQSHSLDGPHRRRDARRRCRNSRRVVPQPAMLCTTSDRGVGGFRSRAVRRAGTNYQYAPPCCASVLCTRVCTMYYVGS